MEGSALTDPEVAALTARLPVPPAEAVRALAPGGVLRAAINESNALLVTGKDAAQRPVGVSPDMAAALARALGVAVQLVAYPSPGAVVAAVASWDVGNVGREPARARDIAFGPAYAEIPCGLLVGAAAAATRLADVDAGGARIAAKRGSAYALWLARSVRRAEVALFGSVGEGVRALRDGRVDAVAGLAPALREVAEATPGVRVACEGFASVQQAVGVPRARGEAGAAYVGLFVRAAVADGLVRRLIECHGVAGKLQVPSGAG